MRLFKVFITCSKRVAVSSICNSFFFAKHGEKHRIIDCLTVPKLIHESHGGFKATPFDSAKWRRSDRARDCGPRTFASYSSQKSARTGNPVITNDKYESYVRHRPAGWLCDSFRVISMRKDRPARIIIRSTMMYDLTLRRDYVNRADLRARRCRGAPSRH